MTHGTFKILLDSWEEKTHYLSNINTAIKMPEAQEFILAGEVVLPFIMEDMEKSQESQGSPFWFPILNAITGENPVPEEHAGLIQLMTEDWLKWWKFTKTQTI